jgi:multimeric flavodoxin WrbA
MSKNIVVVTGSPRAGGNTDALAEVFVEGAKESGNTVTRFNAGRMKINGCLDCKYCTSHDGNCIQKDDMQQIFKALYQADMLVFVSPVYWYGFTAGLKAMIDRLYVATGKPFRITSTALLTVYEDTDTTVVEPIIQHYKAFTGFLKWENKGIVAEGGIHNIGDIKGKQVLEDARSLGLRIE